MSDTIATHDTLERRVTMHWLGWHVPIANRLAWRNITRDRVRLIIAVVGVTFAVILMAVQLSLLIGFAVTSSSLIDNAKADFWVVPRGAKDVDQAGQILERRKYAAAGLPGIRSVESLVVRFADWKRADGGTESVIVVGIDLAHAALVPWNFVAGSVDSLRLANSVVIDELYAKKLGVTRLGETVEVNHHRARVLGLTSGIRTFTQSPYIFASIKTAKELTGLSDGWTTYLLVRADAGADMAKLSHDLQAALPTSDVWSANSFSWQTRAYWLFTTGAGTALLIGALLGLVVGIVIVSQTLYSATVERIQEYATMRAIGASDRYLKGVILRQSFVSGILGYAIGITVAVVVADLAQGGSAAISLSWQLAAILCAVTLTMCLGASLVSMRKVLSIDSATAFR